MSDDRCDCSISRSPDDPHSPFCASLRDLTPTERIAADTLAATARTRVRELIAAGGYTFTLSDYRLPRDLPAVEVTLHPDGRWSM